MAWLCARPTSLGAGRLFSPSIARLPRIVPHPRNLAPRSLHVSGQRCKATASEPASSRSPRAKTRTRASSEPSPSAAAAEETESSVARGTRYELLCRAVLHEMFGMELERTGGAGDRGVDLRGWWSPPSLTGAQQATPDRIRIVAQCKCQDEGGKKMGPVLVREMEGVVFRASSPPPSPLPDPPTEANEDGKQAPLAGILLSSSGFSKQALLQVRSSSVPLAAIHVLSEPLPPSSSGSGNETDLAGKADRCVSIVWSDRFGSSRHGLLDGGMEVRWVRSLGRGGRGELEELGRPVIYRGGSPLQLPSQAAL